MERKEKNGRKNVKDGKEKEKRGAKKERKEWKYAGEERIDFNWQIVLSMMQCKKQKLPKKQILQDQNFVKKNKKQQQKTQEIKWNDNLIIVKVEKRNFYDSMYSS